MVQTASCGLCPQDTDGEAEPQKACVQPGGVFSFIVMSQGTCRWISFNLYSQDSPFAFKGGKESLSLRKVED